MVVVVGVVAGVDLVGDGVGSIAAAAHCVDVVDRVEVVGDGVDSVFDGVGGVGAIVAVMNCLMSVCVFFGTKEFAEGFNFEEGNRL